MEGFGGFVVVLLVLAIVGPGAWRFMGREAGEYGCPPPAPLRQLSLEPQGSSGNRQTPAA